MTNNPNLKGILFLILALLVGSLQAVAVKTLGGKYPVLQMVIFRNLVALPFTLLFFRLEGRRGLPVTKKIRSHAIRGLYLFLSYTTYMMGIAALPLAEVETIRFSGPLMITVLSVVFLSEKVSLGRWFALAVGFGGVLLVVRPGTATYNIGSIFILISVLFYALTVLSTRQLQQTESSATMAFYSSLMYVASAIVLIPFTMAIGEQAGTHSSLAFLLHPWQILTLPHGLLMASLGLVWAAWTYLMARAYSLAKASIAAPFEYVSLPINIMWGYVFWSEVPNLSTLAGAALTLASGLFILFRNARERQ